MENKIKRVAIEIESDVFYDMKSYCVNNRMTIKEFVTKIIKENIN